MIDFVRCGFFLMDLLEAKMIVYREINEPDLSWPEKPEMIILDELTVEKDYGCFFFGPLVLGTRPGIFSLR